MHKTNTHNCTQVYSCSSPGGGGEGRPGIYCMRMRQHFRNNVRKKFHTLTHHVLTCETVHMSKEYKMTSVQALVLNACPPCSKAFANRCGNISRATSKSRSKMELSKPAISRYVEHKN